MSLPVQEKQWGDSRTPPMPGASRLRVNEEWRAVLGGPQGP